MNECHCFQGITERLKILKNLVVGNAGPVGHLLAFGCRRGPLAHLRYQLSVLVAEVFLFLRTSPLT